MAEGKWARKIDDYGADARDKVNFPGLDSKTDGAIPMAAGATDFAGGLMRGNRRQLKSGLKNMAEGGWNIVSGAPVRSLIRDFFKGPENQYYGGSKEALEAARARYGAGANQGVGVMGSGLGASSYGQGILGAGADQASENRGMAQQMYGAGAMIGAQGLGDQNQALTGYLSAASAARQGPSEAELQMRMGLGQTQQAMMAQAAAARGGNQAAAMRGAQATGSQMGLAVNQQAGIMRAQEEQQRLQNELAARQFAAGAYGQQAGLGYGMMGTGLGMANQSTGLVNQAGGQIGQLGVNQANIGLGQQQLYTGAEIDINKSQLGQDVANQDAKQAHKGGIIGTVGKAVGSLFGGGF